MTAIDWGRESIYAMRRMQIDEGRLASLVEQLGAYRKGWALGSGGLREELRGGLARCVESIPHGYQVNAAMMFVRVLVVQLWTSGQFPPSHNGQIVSDDDGVGGEE